MLVLAGLAWAVGLALGLHRVARYESAVGAVAEPAKTWPTDAPARNPDGFTLAVFVHPECPCSVATMSSLDKAMAHAGGRAKAYVFAVMPEGAPADWKQSALLAKAAGIAGVTVVEDARGHFSGEFGAMTSGQTEMFDREGARVFSGGITDGRGHDGANAGLNHIESILNGREITASDTPVFGCSLLGE